MTESIGRAFSSYSQNVTFCNLKVFFLFRSIFGHDETFLCIIILSLLTFFYGYCAGRIFSSPNSKHKARDSSMNIAIIILVPSSIAASAPFQTQHRHAIFSASFCVCVFVLWYLENGEKKNYVQGAHIESRNFFFVSVQMWTMLCTLLVRDESRKENIFSN